MGPGFMAVLGAGISATTVGVAIGVAVVTSSPTLVASTTPRAAIVATAPPAANRTATLTLDIAKLAPGIAHLAADVLHLPGHLLHCQRASNGRLLLVFVLLPF